MQPSAVCALQVSQLAAWCGPGEKCSLGAGMGLEGRMVCVDHICVKGCHLSLDDHEMINHSCNMVEQNSNMQWLYMLIDTVDGSEIRRLPPNIWKPYK